MADRNAAKRRRQQQNKAAREQLAARRTAAQRAGDDGARPARTASGVVRATGRGSSRLSRAGGAANARNGAGSRGGAGTSTRAARQVRPVRPGPPWLARFGYDEPGGRFVIFGAAFTVISSIVLLFLPVVPRGGLGKVAADAAKAASHGSISAATRADILSNAKVHTETIVKAASGLAALYLLGPIVIALITVILARPGNRRRTWAFGAVAMFLWIMVSQGLGIYYIVSFGAMAWGAYTAYRAHREELLAASDGGDGAGSAVPARGRGAAASAGSSQRRPGILESLFKPQPRPQRAPARGSQAEEDEDEYDEAETYEEDEYDEAEDERGEYDEGDVIDDQDDDYDDEPAVYDDEADEEGSESYVSATARQRRRLWRR